MRLEWKKKGHTDKYPPCKNGEGHEHQCCLCGISRDIDCSDEGYTITPGGELTGELTTGLFSSGYDVHWTDTGDANDCIRQAMGEAKGNPNHVPLRIKIHDEGHIDLMEGLQQNTAYVDGGGISCDAWKAYSSTRPDGCGDWDGPHTPNCRRRAGCKSLRLPVPSIDVEEADEEFDDEEFDLDDIDFNTEVA